MKETRLLFTWTIGVFALLFTSTVSFCLRSKEYLHPVPKKWHKFKLLYYLIHGLSDFFNISQACTRRVYKYVCNISNNLIVLISRYGDLTMRQKISRLHAAYRETINWQNVCNRWICKAWRARDVTVIVTSQSLTAVYCLFGSFKNGVKKIPVAWHG